MKVLHFQEQVLNAEDLLQGIPSYVPAHDVSTLTAFMKRPKTVTGTAAYLHRDDSTNANQLPYKVPLSQSIPLEPLQIDANDSYDSEMPLSPNVFANVIETITPREESKISQPGRTISTNNGMDLTDDTRRDDSDDGDDIVQSVGHNDSNIDHQSNISTSEGHLRDHHDSDDDINDFDHDDDDDDEDDVSVTGKVDHMDEAGNQQNEPRMPSQLHADDIARQGTNKESDSYKSKASDSIESIDNIPSIDRDDDDDQYDSDEREYLENKRRNQQEEDSFDDEDDEEEEEEDAIVVNKITHKDNIAHNNQSDQKNAIAIDKNRADHETENEADDVIASDDDNDEDEDEEDEEEDGEEDEDGDENYADVDEDEDVEDNHVAPRVNPNQSYQPSQSNHISSANIASSKSIDPLISTRLQAKALPMADKAPDITSLSHPSTLSALSRGGPLPSISKSPLDSLKPLAPIVAGVGVKGNALGSLSTIPPNPMASAAPSSMNINIPNAQNAKKYGNQSTYITDFPQEGSVSESENSQDDHDEDEDEEDEDDKHDDDGDEEEDEDGEPDDDVSISFDDDQYNDLPVHQPNLSRQGRDHVSDSRLSQFNSIRQHQQTTRTSLSHDVSSKQDSKIDASDSKLNIDTNLSPKRTQKYSK